MASNRLTASIHIECANSNVNFHERGWKSWLRYQHDFDFASTIIFWFGLYGDSNVDTT